MIQRVPYACYAAALATMVFAEDFDFYEAFSAYYDDYINTNLFVSLVITPIVRLYQAIMGRLYRLARRVSKGKALSERVAITFLTYLATAFVMLILGMGFTTTATTDVVRMVQDAAIYGAMAAACAATIWSTKYVGTIPLAIALPVRFLAERYEAPIPSFALAMTDMLGTHGVTQLVLLLAKATNPALFVHAITAGAVFARVTMLSTKVET
jgi:hypothetical protein